VGIFLSDSLQIGHFVKSRVGEFERLASDSAQEMREKFNLGYAGRLSVCVLHFVLHRSDFRVPFAGHDEIGPKHVFHFVDGDDS
jgi:hypothetical protein